MVTTLGSFPQFPTGLLDMLTASALNNIHSEHHLLQNYLMSHIMDMTAGIRAGVLRWKVADIFCHGCFVAVNVLWLLELHHGLNILPQYMYNPL